MHKFPRDAPKEKVLKALNRLSFELVREGNHIAMIRKNIDGTTTPLTLPNHNKIKASTLRIILTNQELQDCNFSKFIMINKPALNSQSIIIGGCKF